MGRYEYGQLVRGVITEETHINTGGRFLPRLLICRVHLDAVFYSQYLHQTQQNHYPLLTTPSFSIISPPECYLFFAQIIAVSKRPAIGS